MAIDKKAYKALLYVVGEKYITDDPVICEAYRAGPAGYECAAGYEKLMTKVPGAVILPSKTEEVQEIVRICNRYRVPFVPYSTGFYGVKSHCHVENELLIDLKRMRHFEIDERHLFVVCGPGIIYSQIQQEALNRGALAIVGGGGSQVSAVANLINDGWSPLCYRVGLPERRILGLEMVLPDGELLRLGSLSISDDPFWGEGIGPDLRGILRGYTGLRGCMGIVTKMAIKLFPFQPEPLEPIGISPNTALKLPLNRVKWLNYELPSKEALVRAIYEIGKAEIASAVMRVPVFWRVIAKSESKEEFWELWNRESEDSVKNFFLLRVLLVGYTSEEQLKYEENVLNDIMSELGGKLRRTKPQDESWIKNADSASMWLMCGAYMSVDYVVDTIDHATEQGRHYAQLKRVYTPPLMEDYGDEGWYQSMELGHNGYSEFLVYWDPDDDTKLVDQFFLETSKMNIRERFYTALLGPNQPLLLTGPKYGPNYHEWLLKIKNEFDPNWLCHPPHPLAHDLFVEKADWLRKKKDWGSKKLEPPVPKTNASLDL